MIYKSNVNPDLIEESTRVKISMKSSDLISYTRNGSEFKLFYNCKSEQEFSKTLNSIENISLDGLKALKRIKEYEIEQEYQGSHCNVQILYKNDKEKLIIKKYHKYYQKFSFIEQKGTKSILWEENESIYLLQNYIECE